MTGLCINANLILVDLLNGYLLDLYFVLSRLSSPENHVISSKFSEILRDLTCLAALPGASALQTTRILSPSLTTASNSFSRALESFKRELRKCDLTIPPFMGVDVPGL